MWKECSVCNDRWESVDHYLSDPRIRFIGMQLDPDTPENCCHYYFTHEVPHCNTTFAINIMKFQNLVDEPIALETLAFHEDCEGLCVSLRENRPCRNANCRNAPFRRLALKIAKDVEARARLNRN